MCSSCLGVKDTRDSLSHYCWLIRQNVRVFHDVCIAKTNPAGNWSENEACYVLVKLKTVKKLAELAFSQFREIKIPAKNSTCTVTDDCTIAGMLHTSLLT